MINKLSKEIHQNNVLKGFYEDKKNIGEMLCLIHSEVSEALEADRNDEYCTMSEAAANVLKGWNSDEDFRNDYIKKVKGSFEEEMADIIIRVLDLCEFKKIDLEYHIKAKMRYNASRPFKHGKKY